MINNLLKTTQANFILISLTVLLQWTEGQVHYFIFNPYPRYFNYFTIKDKVTEYEKLSNNNITVHNNETNAKNVLMGIITTATGTATATTTVTSITATTEKLPSELSESTIDILTICWYVATFMAIAAFFLLMLCSNQRQRLVNDNNDNYNTDHDPTNVRQDIMQQQQQQQLEHREQQLTPAPSYSEFAPPSYDTVIKKDIYIISNSQYNQRYPQDNHYHYQYHPDGSVDHNADSLIAQNMNFYTLNELHKNQNKM